MGSNCSCKYTRRFLYRYVSEVSSYILNADIILLVYRFISWTHKYGMPYFPPFLVAFMVPSATLVRLVPICTQNIVKQVEVEVSSSSTGAFWDH